MKSLSTIDVLQIGQPSLLHIIFFSTCLKMQHKQSPHANSQYKLNITFPVYGLHGWGTLWEMRISLRPSKVMVCEKNPNDINSNAENTLFCNRPNHSLSWFRNVLCKFRVQRHLKMVSGFRGELSYKKRRIPKLKILENCDSKGKMPMCESTRMTMQSVFCWKWVEQFSRY